MATALVGACAIVFWAKTLVLPDIKARLESASAGGDWAQTALLARERLKQAPEDALALRLSARAAANLQKDQSAIAIYSRLSTIDLDSDDFYLLGHALQRTGQIDRAVKAYEAALAANPDHAQTLDALGRLYVRNDRYSALQQAALRLVEQPGWEARGQLMLGISRAELNDPAGAALALGRFFELDPEGHAAAPGPARPIRLLLARSLLKSKQPENARRVLQESLAAGSDPEVSWLLSRSFLQQGDWGRVAELEDQVQRFRAAKPLEPEPAPFVGSARCGECHRSIYEAQIASHHATTFARARDLKILALPAGPLPDPGDSKVSHRFERTGDAIQVQTQSEAKAFSAVIDYAFGSRDHLMSFVGRDDQGQWRTIRMSHYDSPRGQGWGLATGHPMHPVDKAEFLGKPMVDGDGVRRCLYCHTTNFRAVLNESGPEAADHSIGCEACHGPGGHHVAAANHSAADMAIAYPRKATGPMINTLCGQCHNLTDTSVISAPRTDPVWFRFQALTLTWSRCYDLSAEKLSCVTCHDPHRDADRSVVRNEAKCLSCHAAGTKASVCSVNPSRGCIECHMPRAWVESTHSYKTDHFIRVRDRDPERDRDRKSPDP